MIRIVRASDAKTRLWIEMQPSHPLTESVWFVHDCASETERNLLEAHLRTSLSDRIREIRRISYQRGWWNKSDKKGAKSDLFPHTMDIMDWEKTR